MKRGWQTKRLEDFAAAVSTGPFGSILHKSDYVDNGVPLVNPINLVGDRIVPNPSKLIDHVTVKRLSNYVLYEGDVVVGRRGEIGRCAVVGSNEKGWICGTGSFFIRPLPNVDSYFLAHLIRSPGYREQLEKLSTGTTMKNLSNTALGDLVVSIPAIPEQRRIVGILSEAFAGVAAAKASAERNLQNARALFESHLQSVFTQRDGGWPTKQLGDVCDFEGGSQPPKSQFTFAPKHGYVRFLQIRDFGSDKHVTFIPESKKNRVCVADDIMIGRYGASVGKILTGKAGAYNVALMKLIPDAVQVNRSFFYHYLISGAFQERLRNIAARSAQNGFSKEDIYGFPVPVPPLKEQQKVIEQLGPLSEETQRLAGLYQRKLAALEALKKSLLHQAFSGEL